MFTHFSLSVIVFLYLDVSVALCDGLVENDLFEHNRVDPGLIEKLLDRIEGLEKKMEQHEEIIRQQVDANRQQEDTNRKLTEANRQQANIIGQLQLKLGTMEEELSSKKSSKAFAGDAAEDKDTDNLLPKQPVRRALMSSEMVAFTAYLNHNLSSLGIDHPIVYNKVILNEGGAYNSFTGIFTSPYDGIYVFNFIVSTTNQQQVVAKLVVDNVNQVDGVADTFHQNHEAQGGNYVTLSLKAGQSVWVANYRHTYHGDTSSNTNRFSTFSGHLVL